MATVQNLALSKDTKMKNAKKAAKALGELPAAIRNVEKLIDDVMSAESDALEGRLKPKAVAARLKGFRKMKVLTVRLYAMKKELHLRLQDDMADASDDLIVAAGPITRDGDGGG